MIITAYSDPLRGFGRRQFSVPEFPRTRESLLSGVRNSWLTSPQAGPQLDGERPFRPAASSLPDFRGETETSRVTDRPLLALSSRLEASQEPSKAKFHPREERLVKFGSGCLESARSPTARVPWPS